jgi:hypothetical protein
MLESLREANQHREICKAFHTLQKARREHGGDRCADAPLTHAAAKKLCEDNTHMLIELIDAVGPFMEHHHTRKAAGKEGRIAKRGIEEMDEGGSEVISGLLRSAETIHA